jgi:hypothetical protein
MRNAAIISACVHVLVIALIYFGLPTLFAPKPVEELAVPVDIVSLQEAPTAAKPPPKAEPKPAPPKPAPPKPTPPPKAEAPPPPPPPTPPEPPKATPAPEPPPPKAEIVPTPKEKPKPPPKPKPAPKPQPQQQAAVAPPAPVPKRKPKPPPDQFQALLKNLAKEKAQEEKVEKTPKKEPPKKSEPFDVNSLVASLKKSQRSAIDKRRMGANLAQMIQQQITPCWSIPGGAKDVQDMKIAVHIQLNQDGTLRGAPRLEDTRRMQSDPFYRAVAESALRALRNPGCSPLKLPQDQYDLWQDLTFVFEPGEALGQ